MDSLKYDLKVFLHDTAAVAVEEFVPIFHHWIHTQALAELLIDVADYAHVHHGPGVMLIAHDAHYAMDMADGRMGLLYSRRRQTHPTRRALQGTTARLASVLHCALTACQRLEAATAPHGRVQFRGDELLLRLNDRLYAATPAAYQRLLGHLEPLLDTLYPDCLVQVEPVTGADTRLSVVIRAPYSPDVGTLLQRLEERGVTS
jgi:hypothetical protein